MKQKQHLDYRIVLFFEEVMPRPDQLINNLTDRFPEIFDQTPIIFPVPNTSELDSAPVVQSKSTTSYNLNVARKKAELLYTQTLPSLLSSDIQEDFIVKARSLFSLLAEKDVSISRIGFVTKFFIEEKKNIKIVSELINPNFLSHQKGTPHESSVRFSSRSNFENITLNNLTQINTATINFTDKNQAEVEQEGILIIRDFNTPLEINYAEIINPELFEKIIRHAVNSFNLEEIEGALWPKAV